MRAFAYSRPGTLDEALGLLNPEVRPLAGGTDLLTLMKADLAAPAHLVAVRRLLPAGITPDSNGLTLGAGTTLEAIERDALIAQRFAALAQAAAAAASAQLRNMATIGGNLLQRPRCWYFRNPRVDCWLKGGRECPAREGENRLHALFGDTPCVAVHPSDLANALLAFDAAVRVRGPAGERTIALGEFFALPEPARRRETRLREDELVLSVGLPSSADETRSVYLKAMDRQAFSFALVSVAAVVRRAPQRGVIEHARIVLGGVAPIPWRAQAAERVLMGMQPTLEISQRAADAAMTGATPLRHNAWKIPLAKALVQRALKTLLA